MKNFYLQHLLEKYDFRILHNVRKVPTFRIVPKVKHCSKNEALTAIYTDFENQTFCRRNKRK